MAWVLYDGGEKSPQLNIQKMTSNHYKIKIENLTTGKASPEVNYVTKKGHNTDHFPTTIKFRKGLNKIVIEDEKKSVSEEFYYYCRDMENSKYIVRIRKKTAGGRLMLLINSDVDLPAGRLYYKIDNFPFNFDFGKINKNHDYYFVIKDPGDSIKFLIEQFYVPDKNDTFVYPQDANILDYGIDIRITEDS